MGIITSDIPDPGVTLRGPGEVDATEFLTEVKQALNGGIDTTNLSPQLQEMVSPIYVPYGSGLPSAPVDGQIVTVQLHETNGALAQFRYNSGSASPYKWERVSGSVTLSRTGPFSVVANGPVVQLSLDWESPYPGEFRVDCSVPIVSASGPSPFGQYLRLQVVDSLGAHLAMIGDRSVVSGLPSPVSGSSKPVTVPAEGKLRVFGAVSSPTGMTASVSECVMTVTPVRVA